MNLEWIKLIVIVSIGLGILAFSTIKLVKMYKLNTYENKKQRLIIVTLIFVLLVIFKVLFY